MARAALRRFVRGRAIECEVPAGAAEIPNPARCFVAGSDISEWLVAQGWAEAIDADLDEAEKAARQAKLGLFGDGRPGGQPAELAASD
jgi:endonuclease YncB( thermonuclease family)